MKNILFISIFILSVSACSDDLAVYPDYSPGWQPPVVKGMVLTNGYGLPIGTWGAPDFTFDKNPDTFLHMLRPYPNPSTGVFWITFEISRSSKVRVWLSPAQWINESKNTYLNGMGGSLINVYGGREVEVVADGSQESPPGNYRIMIDTTEYSDKKAVFRGFYRVYVQVNEVTQWRDIYIGHPCQKQGIPPGLDSYFGRCPDT